MELLDFEDWLNNKNLRAGSVYLYVSAVKKFLMTNPDIMKIDDYNEFIFKYGIKKRSNYVYDALRLYIKWKFSKENKNIGISIYRNLIKSKVNDPKKPVRYLDEDTRFEVMGLIKDYKHRIMAKLQNATGVRAADILRLKRGTISYEAYQDKIIVMRIDFEGKGGKNFVKWVFDPDVQTQIDLYVKSNLLDTEYYFLEGGDNAKDPRALELCIRANYNRYLKDLKQALDTYGIDYKTWATHDFRRAFAREVWEMTKDPIVLKEMLNHVQFDTTLRYLRGSGLQVKDVYYNLFQKAQTNP